MAAKVLFLYIATLTLCTCSAPKLISFRTQDGGRVFANEYSGGEQAAVLAHCGRFDKESWHEQARVLNDLGFRVLAIDFRGRGQSLGGPKRSSRDEGVELDLVAAVNYLHQSGAGKVFVVGASFGGTAAATAAVMEPQFIAGLVLIACPVDEPEQLSMDKLFILTEDDARGGIKRLPEIRAQFERAPEPKRLVVLPGSAHAQFIFETEQGDRLMEEIVKFLMDRN